MQDLAAASAAVRLGLGRQIFVDAQKKHIEIGVPQRMVANGRLPSIWTNKKMPIPSFGDRTMTIPEGASPPPRHDLHWLTSAPTGAYPIPSAEFAGRMARAPR